MQRSPGFLGLGIMGTPMARHLCARYPGVRVFDVDEPKVRALAQAAGEGAVIPVKDMAELGRLCDLVFLSLPKSDIVRKVILGENGLGETMKKGGVIVDMSTTDVAVITEAAEALSAKGIHLLDAPVSGGEKGAVDASLSIMVGGDESVFSSCKEYLASMGASVIRLGETGSGQTAKAVNQMIVAAAFASITEAFALGAKRGLDAKTLYDAIKGGWAGSKVLDVVAQDILSREFKPGGTIDLILKDIRCVLSLARAENFPAPVTSLSHEIFTAGAAAGDGKKSQTAIIKLWEKVLNIEVR